MKESAISLLLVLAVEAIAAVVNYLKDKLVSHLHRDRADYGPNTEFA